MLLFASCRPLQRATADEPVAEVQVGGCCYLAEIDLAEQLLDQGLGGEGLLGIYRLRATS